MKKETFYATCTLLLLTGLSFSSCSEDDGPAEAQPDLEVTTVADLDANKTKVVSGEGGAEETVQIYTYFSLSEGKEVPAADSVSDKWDIAFSKTKVILNGGVSGPGSGAGQVVDGIFEELAEASESGYAEDAEGTPAISGWYRYTAMEEPQHAILPLAGKVLMIRTADGKYAKIEIISYYEGNPDTSTEEFKDYMNRVPSGFYTFRYVYQPDGSRNLSVMSSM